MKKLLLILLTTLFLVTNLLSLDLAGIRTQIRTIIKDSNSDTSIRHWSDSILNSRINIAQDIIVARTGCLTSEESTTTVTNQKVYSLSSSILDIQRVTLSTGTGAGTSTQYPLYRVNKTQLDDDKLEWEGDSGQPIYWYEMYRGSNTIGIYPKPSSSYAITNGLKVEYTKKPTDLSASTDIPFEGRYALYPYHMAIVYYVVSLCSLDMGDFNLSKTFEDKFELEMLKMFNELNKTIKIRQKEIPVSPLIQNNK